ncbi:MULTISPECIES: hypothetical protein [Nocardia]|uniref:hypothetical protein n=1 Tax=Nocardia TaxID=1817 RepID=UPI00142DC179|nr:MULTISPECIES: hypothetical protein [Nocardia]
MKYKKFAATALLAVAATTVAAGTSVAEPAPAPVTQDQPAAAPTVKGADKGVDYVLQLADAGKSVVTTVTGGAFGLTADKKSVQLKNAAGEVVTEIPLSATAQGKPVEIAAAIDGDATRLTLTPQITPTASAPATAEVISAQEWFFAELQRSSLGALVGGVLGAAIGFLFFIGGAIPGAVIGALIGLAVAGGPSLLNAGIAYFSGQP